MTGGCSPETDQNQDLNKEDHQGKATLSKEAKGDRVTHQPVDS
jgi:hypothetical protein